MTFSIKGVLNGTPKAATRVRAASALVLAMWWTEDGVADVVIVDKEGRTFTVATFRAHLHPPLPKRL